MPFDPKRALAYVYQFAFPRLTGTPGAVRAAQQVAQILQDLGYLVRVQEVTLPFSPWRLYRFTLLGELVLLGLSIYLARDFPFSGALLGLAALLLAVAVGIGWHRLLLSGLSLSTRLPLSGRNIIAENPASTPGDGLHLYLMAHFDSKSQSISLASRIIVVTLLTLLVVSLVVYLGYWGLMAWLSPLPGKPGQSVILGLGVPILVPLLVLLAVKTGNRSPGAMDNASGLGVLLELAETLRESPLRRLKVTLIATDAEEWGVVGASVYLREHRVALHSPAVRLLNIDGVGIPGCLHRIGGWPNQQPVNQVMQSQVARFPLLPGLLLDHVPFARAGIPALSLVCVSRQALAMHTPADRIEAITVAGLAEVGTFIEEWIRELDNVGVI